MVLQTWVTLDLLQVMGSPTVMTPLQNIATPVDTNGLALRTAPEMVVTTMRISSMPQKS